ncbi:helix-turn-helix domain-containing protein [Paenibacillus sp. SEL3]|uniref:Helix-turn-helix transcriptional regulator n=1 Tax=Paenibacillus polymyxa TaxID=1406 RepID=A0A8I1IUH5_PAEPO|nr:MULTISPECIES: helix-turn-helix transcriptional regulator [Paenibacillus]KAF6572224.1 helix-turn-helix transcriptional regulator [Paenibacillus sp. EKM206P]KAF6586637.1 helix-turn-helix transcriptional regulator [Paenibacillus sp. EKM205P]MBM0634873.1 helix-turn-helix transcriptional regulator [Paenibacillus polymyxa]
MLKLKIKLKEVLKEKGITQKQLEELSGVSQARISKLSSGDRQEVNLLMLEKIAHALDIKDISILLQFEEENN